MPAKLPEPQTKTTWRVNTADLDTLEGYYGPGRVNAVVRAMVERHAQAIRERLAGLRAY